jgi:glycine hydroxymethyltransferase
VLCREPYAKDLDRTIFPGVQGGPLMHIIAAKAVCLKEAAEPSFVDYQRRIVANAKTLAAALVGAGFRLVSGGTDNHLMLSTSSRAASRARRPRRRWAGPASR